MGVMEWGWGGNSLEYYSMLIEESRWCRQQNWWMNRPVVTPQVCGESAELGDPALGRAEETSEPWLYRYLVFWLKGRQGWVVRRTPYRDQEVPGYLADLLQDLCNQHPQFLDSGDGQGCIKSVTGLGLGGRMRSGPSLNSGRPPA